MAHPSTAFVSGDVDEDARETFLFCARPGHHTVEKSGMLAKEHAEVAALSVD